MNDSMPQSTQPHPLRLWIKAVEMNLTCALGDCINSLDWYIRNSYSANRNPPSIIMRGFFELNSCIGPGYEPPQHDSNTISWLWEAKE